MGLAGMNDAFELGIGQQTARDDIGREMRSVRGFGRRDRRHRRRLHQFCRMSLRAGNTDRLQSVFFIERIGDAAAFDRASVDRYLIPTALSFDLGPFSGFN